MDNKTVLMVIVAIVLGMLVANMFKEVCGCKNLIEGQQVGYNPGPASIQPDQRGCIIGGELLNHGH
mgnify:CR=1 FL=1